MNLFSVIRARIHNVHPDHHAIAGSMVWVALFVLLGSTARAAREMAIAYRYGISDEVDAYLFLFNLVSWPVGVWFSILTVVLVPLAARIRQAESAELPRFRSELLGLTLALGLVLAFLGWLGLPLLLTSSWSGLPPTTATMASLMVPTLALLAPLGVLIGLFSVWMLASGQHANTMLESVPSLVLLMALFAFPGGEIATLVLGTLVGFMFHLISLVVHLARQGEIEAPSLTQQSTQWPAFWQGFGIMLVGQALMSFTTIVDQFFAAHLGTGAISTLGYANRILTLILGVGAMTVTRATLPVFSKVHEQGGRQLHRVAGRWAGLMFALGLVITIGGWWLAPWGVRLFFEHGAFTPDDAKLVAEVFRYGLPQLPFYFAGLVLVSLLVSQRRYREISVIGVINLVVKIISSVFVVPYLGVGGLMISTTIMLGISCLLLIMVTDEKFRLERESI
jgi:putative peptidoglycan lipid II flippase